MIAGFTANTKLCLQLMPSKHTHLNAKCKIVLERHINSKDIPYDERDVFLYIVQMCRNDEKMENEPLQETETFVTKKARLIS